jgi:hypothetical protein
MKVTAAYFFCTLPESAWRIKENYEKHNSWCPKLDTNQSPQKYKSKASPFQSNGSTVQYGPNYKYIP